MGLWQRRAILAAWHPDPYLHFASNFLASLAGRSPQQALRRHCEQQVAQQSAERVYKIREQSQRSAVLISRP
jgi:hypothetical protein